MCLVLLNAVSLYYIKIMIIQCYHSNYYVKPSKIRLNHILVKNGTVVETNLYSILMGPFMTYCLQATAMKWQLTYSYFISFWIMKTFTFVMSMVFIFSQNLALSSSVKLWSSIRQILAETAIIGYLSNCSSWLNF